MSTSTEQRTQSSTTQTRDPYEGAKPLLGRLIESATNIAGRPGMFRNTFGPDSQDYFAAGRDIAGQTQPAFGAGIDEITATARGDNLNGNPYYTAALDNSLDRIQNRVNQNFSAAGRYGSGAHTGTLVDRLGEAEIAAMRDNYKFERGNQINAANSGVNLGFQGAGVLDMIGQRQDALRADNRLAPVRAATAASGIGLPIASQFGTTSGTSTGSTVSETPMNIPGMVVGGLTAGAGLLSGNPMMGAGMFGSPTAAPQQIAPPYYGSNGLFW